MNNTKKTSKLNLLLSTFFAFTLFNFIDIPVPTNFLNSNLDFSQQALAKSRGGRSGGGSFKSRSSSSSRSTTKTSGSRERSNSSNTDKTIIIQNNSYHRSYGVPFFSGHSHGGIFSLFSLIFLLMFFGLFGFIAYLVYAQKKAEREEQTKEYGVKNHKVTISKLQIALTAEAKAISQQLSQLTLSIDTSTEEGLVELLQESMMILLRNSEYWTHVLSRSFSIKIDDAEAAFNRLSVAQRSKFSLETVSNINGKIRNYVDENNQHNNESNENLPAYIIVTILVGSAGKEPLFNQIHSSEELKNTLEKLAVLDGNDLMKLEILWTPQSENESLTNDEFIMEYTDMIQLV
jgi:uncharacterized membrane protein